MKRRAEMLWHRVALGHRYFEDHTRGRRYRVCECGRRWYR